MRAVKLARMATITVMLLVAGLLIWPANVTLAWHPRWSVSKDCAGWEAKIDATYTENGVTYRGEVRERQNMKGQWSPGQTSVTARAYVVWPGHDQGWFSVTIQRPTENCTQPSPTPTSPPNPTATPTSVPPTASPTAPPAATATPTSPPNATATPTAPPAATATPTTPPSPTVTPPPAPTKPVDQPQPSVTPTQPAAGPIAPTATPRRRSSRPINDQPTPVPSTPAPATATPVPPVTEPAISPPAATPTPISEAAPLVAAPVQRQHEAEAIDDQPRPVIIPAGLPRTGTGGPVAQLPLAALLSLLVTVIALTARQRR